MLETNMSFRRGILEPCLYTAADDMTNMLHHVDYGRIICLTEATANTIVSHLAGFMLLKVSEPIGVGQACKYLRRTKIRIQDGWITIPDSKQFGSVFQLSGLYEKIPRRLLAPQDDNVLNPP
jgi:hypothetical protein